MSDWNFFPANDQALHLDGTSQYAYLANPSFQADSAGAISMWVRINTALTSDGAYALMSLSDSGTKVGTYGRFLLFSARRSAGFGNTNTYLDLAYTGAGSNVACKSGSTVLPTGSWFNVITGSSSKLYFGGSEETTYQYWNPVHITTPVWYSGVAGSNHDLAFGNNRLASAATASYSPIDICKVMYLSGRTFTGTEAAEVAALGVDGDMSSLSMYASLSPLYPFDGDANDSIGTQHLTLVGSPTYTDV